MSDSLNPGLAERTLWPYAVGVLSPGATSPDYMHFDSKPVAALFADLCTGEGTVVTRWVAVVDDHILRSTVLGWREVGYFALAEGATSSTEPDCEEFRENGSCIHSEHMMEAGL